MKALTSSKEIPVSTVVRLESIPEVDCALECVDFCRGEYDPNSMALCEVVNEVSGKRVKSATLSFAISSFGKFALSGEDLKDDIVGDKALEIGEQCEEL